MLSVKDFAVNTQTMLLYDEVHIVSGGKTGNQTLTMSFRRLFPNAYVNFSHDSQRVKRAMQYHKKILVINSYREPVSRMISSLFHNLQKIHIPDFHFHRFNRDNYPIVKERLDRYMDNREYFEWYHPLEDLIALQDLPPFDKDAKWCMHHLPQFDLLLLRFDQIANWGQQLRQVFPTFELVPCNVSSQKKYGGLYNYFKLHYHLHPNFQELFDKDQEWYDHYFTPSETNILKKKLFSKY